MRKRANILLRIKARLKKIWGKKISDWRDIPIIINNFNRLSFLEKQISYLENCGLRNIYIIDNDSTYPPLLDYYRSSVHTIFKLDRNKGYRALFDTHIIQLFENDFYVYTDPDIIPISECPSNFLEHFKNLLGKYQEIGKIGFSLKIDDLPDHYRLKNDVIEYEKRYWERCIENEVYDALIDTTFALYRPNAKGDWQLKAYRTNYPYLARHLPWYEDSNSPSDEELYYISTTTKNSLWYTNLKKNINP